MASLSSYRFLLSRCCNCRFASKTLKSLSQAKPFVNGLEEPAFKHAFLLDGGNQTIIQKRGLSIGSRLYADTETVDTGSKEYIKKLVNNSKVVVFMKGVPDQPMCGFSNAVVQILRMHGVEYDSHNVLDDDSLRAGVKEFSDWPTIPQVYFEGEFIGGCDILLQIHQNGDLIDELKKIGIRSALLDKDPS